MKKALSKAEIEFFMEPLRDKWQEDGKMRAPKSLDEAATNAGYKSWEQYYSVRNRQWIFEQIPTAIAKAQSKQKEIKSGQLSLF